MNLNDVIGYDIVQYNIVVQYNIIQSKINTYDLCSHFTVFSQASIFILISICAGLDGNFYFSGAWLVVSSNR